MDYNFILDTDSYKHAHFQGYPDDIEYIYSYAESRGGMYPGTVLFGLQAYLQNRLSNRIVETDVEEAADLLHDHGLPFNRDMWCDIIKDHDGFLPLDIRALDEGLHVPVLTPLVSIVNTDPRMKALVGHTETGFLRHLWYGTTVATRIFHMKHKIKRFFDETSADDMSGLPFAVLDFSSRGCAGYDANELGGGAYLTLFQGSDSLPAVRYMNEYYMEPGGMSGYSVPATEHSVMCSWKNDGVETIRALLQRMGRRGGILSIVADTWNVYECAKTIASMRDEFAAAGVIAVIRPDSGDMHDVLPQVIRIVADGFGTRTNGQGYSVINGAKVLQGDGINEDTCTVPFEIAKEMKISAASIMTGSGGGLMQHNIDRDTCQFAFKGSAIKRVGEMEWEGIRKDPITSTGKRSKAGRHMVFMNGGGFWAVASDMDVKSYNDPGSTNLLRPRYLDGALLNLTNLAEIRTRIDAQL